MGILKTNLNLTNMKPVYSLLLIAALSLSFQFSSAQSVKELQETARTFMSQGDFTNAFLVLNRASSMEPKNIEITKDLALNYFFQRQYTKAIEELKPVLDREDVDDQCYQLAGDSYKQMDEFKESDKIYRRGIKKFPNSGLLYCTWVNCFGNREIVKPSPNGKKVLRQIPIMQRIITTRVNIISLQVMRYGALCTARYI
jgi:tetratricopeptide (TPR) repeat protein